MSSLQCDSGWRRRFVDASVFILVVLFSGSSVSGQALKPVVPTTVERMLICNAVTSINQANLTGNYTVLRDLGSQQFREKNSAAKLSDIFRTFRDNKIDLSPTLVLAPNYSAMPTRDATGLLLLEGWYDTEPRKLRFSIAYRRIEQGWVLDGVSLQLAEGAVPQPEVGNSVAQ